MASRAARVRLAKMYMELRAGSTAFSGARVDPRGADGCVVEVVRSQVDLQRFSDLPSSNKYLLNGAGDVVMKLNSVALERGKTVLESTSPSGQWQVRVRAGDKADELWLEVWGAQGLVSSLKASDKTSKVYNDDLFGGVSWSMSEGKVCFIGEVAAPKKFKSYFEEEAAAGAGGAAATGSAASEPEVWFDQKYEYKESFGETMDDKVNPAIFVLDVASNKLDRVQLAGEAIYPQQPIFDEKDGLVFAGLLLPVKKLGLNFCLNHKTTLFHVLPSALSAASGAVSPTRLTPSAHFLAFNARFSRDRSRLVFFGREEAFLSHSGNYELFYIDWRSKSPPLRVVGRKKQYPAPGEPFSGLFGYQSSFACADFVGGSNSLFVLQSLHKGRSRIYAVDVDNGTVAWLNFMQRESGESEMLALRGNTLVFKFWSFNEPPSVLAATFFVGGGAETCPASPAAPVHRTHAHAHVKMVEASESAPSYSLALLEASPPAAPALTTEVEQRVFTLPNGAEAYLTFNTRAAARRPLGCVVILHGGPFSASQRDAWLLQRNMFIAMGLAPLVINYRGSIGYGEAFLDALLGNIGRADVEDCGELVKMALAQSEGVLDPQRIACYGGSHGGFLTGWMIGGQYRQLFKCGVLWNAVLNMSYMAASTDIPDWIAACNQNKPLDYAYGAEDNALFFDRSPFSVINNVQCPTVLIVGEADKRVPPQQSYAYYNALKSRGVDVTMFTYAGEGHAVSINTEKSVDANLHVFFAVDKHICAGQGENEVAMPRPGLYPEL
jgi:acylaminoacyl-peptidase